MALPVCFTLPDAGIDATRGSGAIERGPIVYCLERADLPDGASLDDIEVEAGAALALAWADDSPLKGHAHHRGVGPDASRHAYGCSRSIASYNAT